MILDIENPKEELEKLNKRFEIINNRFLAIAMDYKHYIDSTINDNEVYKLRDNVIYRLQSSSFHFQLLLNHHHIVENRLKELYKQCPEKILKNSFELMAIQEQSTKEIYSLFDSLIYHLCSIYDYLFRLINFSHGKTIVKNPKWNLFKSEKNYKSYEFCSKEIIPKLDELDKIFVYPLIKHRSHLIHTENDIGDFKLTFNLGGDNFNAKYKATKLFIENFPLILNKTNEAEFTIKYASIWLIDQTIITTTDILFELREDMIRNKKISHGMFVLLGSDNTVEAMSSPFWGDRNIN